MRINSKLLLIMTLGNLQYPDLRILKGGTPDYYGTPLRERQWISTSQLQRFAIIGMKGIFKLPFFKALETTGVDFPTQRNINDWGDMFEVWAGDVYLCKPDKLNDLFYEVCAMHRSYPIDEIKKLVNEVVKP